MPKKILINMSPGLLEEVDAIARAEHRTRSDFVRECIRRYILDYRRNYGAPVSTGIPLRPSTPPLVEGRQRYEGAPVAPQVPATTSIS